jgi:hypothetical protein
MNTSLILRPKDAPKIHVLEVDGPRRRYALDRSEGSYRLSTDNHPIDTLDYAQQECDPRIKHWNEPSWEIYQLHDGSVEIHANRPTRQEMMRGDLHGRWGSVIHLGKNPSRFRIRIGLQLARSLCRVLPQHGFTINKHVPLYVDSIETEIPIKLPNGSLFSTLSQAS